MCVQALIASKFAVQDPPGSTYFIVNLEETGFEAWQTSKEQTKMPRFILKGPQGCTIFCFMLMHYAKHKTKNFDKFHNHSPLLTMHINYRLQRIRSTLLLLD